MKVKIKLNEQYAQKLLNDDTFRNELALVINAQNYIEEIWIKNNALNNDEQTFRAQALNLIRVHFCRIYEIAPTNIELAHQDHLPIQVLKIGQMNPLRDIATITDFQLD